MKLAFSGEARYPDFNDGYRLYSKRVRDFVQLGFSTYRKVVKMYCASLAERLCENGMVDLPSGLGSICAVTIRRKPQYRGKKFIGYGKMNWDGGYMDGDPVAFGIVFLPNRKRNMNLRSYGFVANRKLYKKMKELYSGYDCKWVPLEFSDELI